MLKVYGIKNCDTVKKSLKALEDAGHEVEFIDFKKTPPTPELIKTWKADLGRLPVNEKGRTYKQNAEVFEALSLKDQIEMLCDKSSMIKRPIVVKGSKIKALGYEPEIFSKL